MALVLSYQAITNQIGLTWVMAEHRVSLARYFEGTAHRPFVRRTMTSLAISVVLDGMERTDLLHRMPARVRGMLEESCRYVTVKPSQLSGHLRLYCRGLGEWLPVPGPDGACAWGLFRQPLLARAAIPFAPLVVNGATRLGAAHIHEFAVPACGAALLLTLLAKRFLLFTLPVHLALLNR